MLLFFSESAGWAYRPFIATDAAVADINEMEIELGYFNWEQEKGNTTFFFSQDGNQLRIYSQL